MSDDIEEAKTYLRNLLTSFVHEHCDPVPEWAPLTDLVGMLTQIDNAICVTRDRQAEIARLREALRKCQSAIATMIDPTSIGQTTVLAAFAQATEAEAAARAALEQKP